MAADGLRCMAELAPGCTVGDFKVVRQDSMNLAVYRIGSDGRCCTGPRWFRTLGGALRYVVEASGRDLCPQAQTEAELLEAVAGLERSTARWAERLEETDWKGEAV